MSLLVSIHDVTPALEQGVFRLWELCTARRVCPALLVVGEKDPMGAGASVIIQRHLREATLEVVPEHGHWLHVDGADALLEALDRFLASQALAGGRDG